MHFSNWWYIIRALLNIFVVVVIIIVVFLFLFEYKFIIYCYLVPFTRTDTSLEACNVFSFSLINNMLLYFFLLFMQKMLKQWSYFFYLIIGCIFIIITKYTYNELLSSTFPKNLYLRLIAFGKTYFINRTLHVSHTSRKLKVLTLNINILISYVDSWKFVVT